MRVQFTPDEMHALDRWARIKVDTMKALKRRFHYPAFMNHHMMEMRGAMAEYGFTKVFPELKSQWSWETPTGKGDNGIDYTFHGVNIDIKGTGPAATYMSCNGKAYERGTCRTDIYVAGRVEERYSSVTYEGWIRKNDFYTTARIVEADGRLTRHYRLDFRALRALRDGETFT